MKTQKSHYQKQQEKLQKQVAKIDAQKRSEDRFELVLEKMEDLRNERLRRKAYFENDLVLENIQTVSNL